MATFTLTKVTTRPNTSTQWPHEVHGKSGYDDISEKVSKTISYSADELVQTIVSSPLPNGARIPVMVN